MWASGWASGAKTGKRENGMTVSSNGARGMGMAHDLSRLARRVPEWPLYPIGMIPAAWVAWQALEGRLGPDPVRALENTFGLWGLRFLLASLCITPLMRFARVNLMKFRRPLGLLGFFYAGIHVAVWLVMDLQMRWAEIGTDLTRRPYIVVGAVAFACLIPLALSSSSGAVRRMGPVAWKRLHRLAYLAIPLGAIHLAMQEKVWTVAAVVYPCVAVGLVSLRWVWRR